MPRALVLIVLAGCLCSAAIPARAHKDGDTYEASRIAAALTEAGLEVDDAPAGKRIAFVRLVSHDVFVPEEPWPEWPNALHTLTRPSAVEREYLFAVGETFNGERIDETERNLRSMGIFALARVIPVKSSEPNTVGLMVHTRDLWSLRTEWDLQITGAVLDRLALQGAERNVAGYGKIMVARFQLVPITFSLGQVFQDRRLFLGEHRLDQSFDAFFNRESGAVEGTQGRLVISKPFYNLAQTLSYAVDAQYITKIARVLRTGAVATYDIPETAAIETIPRLWDDRSGSVIANIGYRTGEEYKALFTVGAGYRDRSVEPQEQTGLLSDQFDYFRRDVLPRVRREAFPSLSIEVFEAKFATYQDLATFGQSENVRVGPSAAATATAPLRLFGSSTNSVTLALGAGYVLPMSGGLLEMSGSASGRHESGVLINQLLTLQARGATPFIFAGRLVFRTRWEGRRRDTENTPVSLGGDNGLRGYPSQALIGFGASRILSSFEYRTRPMIWRSAQVGLVAFYDAGSVYESLRTARVRYAVGTGVRVLFPQFDRFAFRLDVGMPLGEPGFQLLTTFGSAQAVPVTAIEDDLVATSF